jgi:tellurite resistance protein TehA-like permease
MDIGWALAITIIVFLIVFFVAWGMGVRPISAVALACIYTLIVQMLLFPATNTWKDIIAAKLGLNGMSFWTWLYWLIGLFFIVYIIFYITWAASKDVVPRKHRREMSDMEDLMSGGSE